MFSQSMYPDLICVRVVAFVLPCVLGPGCTWSRILRTWVCVIGEIPRARAIPYTSRGPRARVPVDGCNFPIVVYIDSSGYSNGALL